MRLINQKDYKGNIGHSNATISGEGCVISDLSMLSDWYGRILGLGKFHDPEWMAKNLRFTKDGLVFWNSITENKDVPFKFVWRYYNYDEAHLLPALNGKTTSAMLRINLVIKGKTYVHWVTGIRKIGNLYYVADSLGGYRHTIARSSITGFATFDRK